MQSRLGSPDRNSESIGNLGQRKTDVVVEHEHGPLLDREPPEGPIELITVVDRSYLIRIQVATWIRMR